MIHYKTPLLKRFGLNLLLVPKLDVPQVTVGTAREDLLERPTPLATLEKIHRHRYTMTGTRTLWW